MVNAIEFIRLDLVFDEMKFFVFSIRDDMLVCVQGRVSMEYCDMGETKAKLDLDQTLPA